MPQVQDFQALQNAGAHHLLTNLVAHVEQPELQMGQALQVRRPQHGTHALGCDVRRIHFQVEGMDIGLSLVSQMPKAKS